MSSKTMANILLNENQKKVCENCPAYRMHPVYHVPYCNIALIEDVAKVERTSEQLARRDIDTKLIHEDCVNEYPARFRERV